ncbi:SMP-30/gluconolactonase/LRE family protein [Geojedonia litorea]|uniref:SMP-30/gluconolactonase/LRE family protein n=1 Tax=Geojedonia litorea TaxID=1268269 RepID=A0ABV9MYS1_9FLAO
MKHQLNLFWKLRTLFIVVTFTMSLIGCQNKKKQELPSETVNTLKNKAILEYNIKAQLGEGAFWNHQTQEFYWIDIEAKQLHIYNPKTKTNRTLETPSRIGTVVPIDTISALVALEDGIYKMNITTGETTLLSDVEQNIPTNRFNDGKCDPSGRLWVGSMGLKQRPHVANLYMIDAKGQAHLKLDSITISNGIVWTKDKATMYYIDTPTLEIKAFDYDDVTGTISNPRIAVKVADSLGYPDGMTIDEHDNLWVGMWNGNAVLCFDPKTGEVISRIEVPAHNVTSCAFGGTTLDTLFITTASIDMSEEEQHRYPLAGSVFKAVPGVKGVKNTFFKTE